MGGYHHEFVSARREGSWILMVGYLRSRECFDQLLQIGPTEGDLCFTSTSDVGNLPLLGFFSTEGGRYTLFYRWRGELRLRIQDSPPIVLTDARATWEQCRGVATFTLTSGKTLLWSASYPVDSNILGIADDPTPFVEAEHFDILLLVANVINDPARAKRIFPENG